MKGAGPVFRVKLRRGNLNSKSPLQRRHDSSSNGSRGTTKQNTSRSNAATATTTVFSICPQDQEKMAVPNLEIVQMIKDTERRKKEKERERITQIGDNIITYYLQNDPTHTIDPSMLARSREATTSAIKRTPLEICRGRRLNAFMAFRIYYSQFGSGLRQDELSSILSRA